MGQPLFLLVYKKLIIFIIFLLDRLALLWYNPNCKRRGAPFSCQIPSLIHRSLYSFLVALGRQIYISHLSSTSWGAAMIS